MTGKYSWKPLDHAKKSATDASKTASKKVIQKTPEATGDLIGNKISNKIMGFQKICNKIIQTPIMIKKYPNKDIYPQKKDSKLLMT